MDGAKLMAAAVMIATPAVRQERNEISTLTPCDLRQFRIAS
jgi:hypothetical protein